MYYGEKLKGFKSRFVKFVQVHFMHFGSLAPRNHYNPDFYKSL